MRSRDSLQTFTDRMRAAQGRAAATLRGFGTDLEYDHRGWFLNLAGYY
jgi:hypothetical protein